MHADGGVDERDSGRPGGCATSRSGGPSPVPMAIMRSTPAASARSITCSRSASNFSSSRWQCESTSVHFRRAPDRDVFEEAGQHRLAAFDATPPRSCRSIRCRAACAAADSRRSPPCGRPAAPARRLRRCRPRWCAAPASPMSTFMCSSLSAPLTALGGEHQADAQIHLDEIVDRDLAALGGSAAAAARRGFLPSSASCSAVTSLFQLAHLRRRLLQLRCAGRRRRSRRSSGPAGKLPHCERVEAHGFERLRSCRAAPRSSAPIRGSTGESSAVAMRSASAAV